MNNRLLLAILALIQSFGAFLSGPNLELGHLLSVSPEGNRPGGATRTAGPAEWTFMVYMDADNNLEEAGIDDFFELSSVGSTSQVNIVVQFDRISSYDITYGDWTDTRRFFVTSGLTPAEANGISIGEANMGDPQTLVDFVEWGMAEYPAERYAVILWDHGSGWVRTLEEEPVVKSIAIDDTDGDALTMPELRGAMATLSNDGADPLDLVGFDACLMAMAEVDNELIPYVDVRVGSEENEPWDGWPYTEPLTALTANPTMSAAQLGTEIVDAYYAHYETNYDNGWTQSAVDLGSAYASLNSAVDDFAGALIDGMAAHGADISDARSNVQVFANHHYVDLYDFAVQINRYVTDPAINAAATAVTETLTGAVIRERHGTGWPGAHGISIYFPASESSYRSTYDGGQGFLQFTANGLWDEWLHTYYTGGAVAGPLTFESYAVDDDDLGDSSGNDDGFVNPGETIELYVTLYNEGFATATAVTATLSTGDTYISGFVSSTSSYADIAGREAGVNLDGWDLAINPLTPDGHVVTFCVDPSYAEGSEQTDCFELTVADTRTVYLPLVIREVD